MKLKTLSTAMILATVPMTGAFAAALDRSGQSISAFLQPGNYFEAGISVLDPNVSGKVNNGYTPNQAAPASAIGLQNTNLSDMGDDYYFPSAALKLQLISSLSREIPMRLFANVSKHFRLLGQQLNDWH